MVAALTAGEPINPDDGARGKQRSVHNTYLTLPVLFIMISNHYASTYSSEWNWLILIGMTIAGALIRVYFVARHKGNASPLPAVGGPRSARCHSVHHQRSSDPWVDSRRRRYGCLTRTRANDRDHTMHKLSCCRAILAGVCKRTRRHHARAR